MPLVRNRSLLEPDRIHLSIRSHMRTFLYILLPLMLVGMPAQAKKPATQVPASPPPSPSVEVAPMLPGLWETAVFIEVAGEEVKHTNIRRVCYTKDIIATPQQLLPQQQEVGSTCTTRDFTLQSGVASWSVTCTTKDGTLSGPGQISLGPKAYSGKGELTLKRGGKSVKVTQGFAGKRLGDCQP